MGMAPLPSFAAGPTAQWDLYQNKEPGFAIKYPRDWQPRENEAVLYLKSQLPRVGDVCFGDLTQKDLPCKVELYVTHQGERLKKDSVDSSSTFLGFPRLEMPEPPDSPRTQDGLPTTRVDVTTPEGRYLSHVFFKKDDWVYLFVMRDFNRDDLDYLVFRSMISSFVFLEPDTEKKGLPVVSKGFEHFLKMTPEELESVHVKMTYLGPQTEPILTVVLSPAPQKFDIRKFSGYRRLGLSYINDDLTPEILKVTPGQLQAVISAISSYPTIAAERVVDVPYLSVSFLYSGPEEKFFETILNHQSASEFFILLRGALATNREALEILQSWGCALALLPPVAAREVTDQVEVIPGGVRFNSNSGFFEQTVTLKNISYEPLPGPISLIIDFDGSTRLRNGNGTTCSISPQGIDYIDCPLPSGPYGSFFPKEELEVILRFETEEGEPIHYSTKVVGTFGER